MELEEKRGLQQLSLSRDNLAVNKSDEQWDMELEEKRPATAEPL